MVNLSFGIDYSFSSCWSNTNSSVGASELASNARSDISRVQEMEYRGYPSEFSSTFSMNTVGAGVDFFHLGRGAEFTDLGCRVDSV